jgi:hypothetical protein
MPSQKITTEEFIKRAKQIHGDKYSYDLVVYAGRFTRVKIRCPIHEIFNQSPNNHLIGNGCNTCRFIERSKEKHGDKYDYSKCIYKHSHKNIIIICKKHGEFEQTPASHLHGAGCQKCGIELANKNKRRSTQEFIRMAKRIHGNKYGYDLVIYTGCFTKVKIRCHTHGIFKQSPNLHLCGNGCNECRIDKMRKGDDYRKTKSQFIKDAKKVYGNKYNYKLVNYINRATKVKIICPIHGIFTKTPGHHLEGGGCPKCQRIKHNDLIRKSRYQFIKEARKIHGKKYNYKMVDYKGCFNNVEIICRRHGIFKKSPQKHLRGDGCNRCKCEKREQSRIEKLWLDTMGIPNKLANRQVTIHIKNKWYYADGYKDGTIYEFYGDYWHGNPNRYDPSGINKTRKISFGKLYKDVLKREKDLKRAGYKLVTIWESDFRKQLKT